MTDKTQSLVPGRLHPPAAIEQRTRITNRLLGELISRDTEAFFRRHPEFFRLVVSRYYPLNEDIIERFKDQLDWANLSANKALIWSEILLEKYQDNWDWESLSGNESLPWNRYLLENYQDYWDWQKLSQILPWDENLIACFADYWDWDILSERKDLPWSCYFICQFEGRWAWDLLTRNESLLWSEDLLDWFRDRWDWNWLSENKPLSLSQELLLRFYDYWNLEILSWNVCFLERDTESWNWKSLSKKKNLPWNEAFIEQYQDYWDWDNLSRNEGLPWSESLIEKFIDHWNWNELSGNEVLPWSQKLIEKFKSRWNWELFSENKKLPWNMVWGKEYLERYKYVYDPEPLDFIERFMDESNHHWTSTQIDDWCIEQNELYWQVWTNLSKNELLPWSHQLFDRYEDRWNIKSVASHYDGNVRSLTLEQVDRLILLASSEAVESPTPKTRELVSDEELLSVREERPDLYDSAVNQYLSDYETTYGDSQDQLITSALAWPPNSAMRKIIEDLLVGQQLISSRAERPRGYRNR